jgi:hypothetical protein
MTPEEREAAVSEVRANAHGLRYILGDSSGMGLREEINAAASATWVERFLENEARTIDERGIKKLVSAAIEGNTSADARLCAIASRMLAWEKALPPPLAEYVSKVLQGRFEEFQASPKMGRPRSFKDSMRNDFIFSWALDLISGFKGLQATRNRETKFDTSSACSIVAEGFGLSESSVNKIWKAEFERRRQAERLQQVFPHISGMTVF